MDRLTVYGFGNRGRNVVDQLVEQGLDVAMIFDRTPSSPLYRGIPVCDLGDPEARSCAQGSHCVVALHNSYVDIREVNFTLRSHQATPISLINADRFGLSLRVDNGFWLNKTSPAFKISEDNAAWMREVLADTTSINVFESLRLYRETGDIADCPQPSTADEYTPEDLPRYSDPIHLVDCGAYTGVAYRKFAKHYMIGSYLAFEPDPKNFAELNSFTFGCPEVTLLPLGVWNRTEVLRFQIGQDMGSTIDNKGEAMVQCVAVDDVARTFQASVVKFDVEGAEMQGLLGMRGLISRCRPALCISVYHKPEDLVEIPKLLASWDLGYRFYLRTHEHNAFGTVLYARPEPERRS
jgi:FkbM family methyltransferase